MPELLLQSRGQRQQVAYVIERVFDLLGGQRAARPVSARVGLGELLSQESAHSFRVADLGGQAGESGGDLGVKHRPHQARERQQHLEVLAGGMHDLDDAGGGQHARQRRQIGERERIDAHGVVRRRQLHEAQLRAIGALAQELGVQADARLRGKTRGERGKVRRCADDALQTGSGDDLYNRA